METFNVEFAKLNIEVNCNYTFTKTFCKNYLCDGAPDFSVSVTQEDIDAEIACSPYQPKRGYAESICAYREIAKQLPFFERIVFHGAVIEHGGKGFLFTAPSGTGKTTHICLWKKYLDGVEIVNGDKPILHISDRVTAYATPYAGKEGYENHSSTGLSAICIIHRGATNRITRLKSGECLTEIIKQMYIPPSPEAAVSTLALLDKMLKLLPVYLLECDISEEAVRTSYEVLTGKKYGRRQNEN